MWREGVMGVICMLSDISPTGPSAATILTTILTILTFPRRVCASAVRLLTNALHAHLLVKLDHDIWPTNLRGVEGESGFL